MSAAGEKILRSIRHARAILRSAKVGEENMPANWQDITIPAGQTESDLIDIPYDLISVPGGKLRASDGTAYRGSERPRFTVVEPAEGQSRIVLNQACDKDLVFKVKAEQPDAE